MRWLAGHMITFAARRAARSLERAVADTRGAQEALLARMMQKNRGTE